MYSYKDSRANIINILKSKTPIEKKYSIPADNEFTYENGVMTWVASVFVDIVDSSKLFASKDEKLARLMRAFTSEIICIFQDLDNYNEIGIRGDCVYVIYDIKTKNDLADVFSIVTRTNAFLEMFNKIIGDYGYKRIDAGIGLGCDEDLIIKAGRSGTGINDKIWIGKAIVDASNLSSTASRDGIGPIAMSHVFYSNIIGILKKENPKYEEWIQGHRINCYTSECDYYYCDLVQTDFDDWINGGMK